MSTATPPKPPHAVWVALEVMRRELTEALREPHVLAFSVGFPIIFYPLLLWGVLQLLMLQDGMIELQPPAVVVSAPADVQPALDGALFGEPGLDGTTVAGDVPTEADAVAAMLRSESDGVDVVVVGSAVGPAWTVDVHHLSTRSRSAAGARKVGERLDDLRVEREATLATAQGLSADGLDVWSWDVEDMSSKSRIVGQLMGVVLPVMLLSAMMVSGIYPAVEIVVGEKERATLETTLVSSAPRGALIVGKLGALLFLIALSVAGNLGAMVLTLLHLLLTMTEKVGVSLSLDPGEVLIGACMLAVQGFMLAGMLVVATLPARTFKQGQNLASMVSTLGMLPAMISMMPTAELSWTLAAVPISNTAIIMREAIAGEGMPTGPLVLAFAVNISITAVLYGLAVRKVQREDTWFGSGQSRMQKWIARLSGEGSS